MASGPHIDLKDEVNAILNIAMRDLNVPNDNQLARKLGVTFSGIKKWRDGKLSPSSRALVSLLIQQHHLDVTKPRRRYRKSEKV